MPKTKATSPARSQGGITTPKRKPTRGSRSLCSPALSTASGRLTSLIDQFRDKNMESFALSPLNGRSVLNDNTEIEEPRRKSWWKKLGENSQDVMEVLEDNQLTDVNDIIEEFIDIEVLSQERKNYTLDLPESSDNESINSIVLPQRRLFTQKENQPQKKYGHLIDNRESLAKLHKTNTANIDKTINVAPRDLFQNTKRSKPIFPAALLNISPNKTKENMLLEPKPQVRNIFGNRPANKRKNMFADFIVSESEDEIPDIEPKVFGFQKKIEQRRISSISKGRDGSPASSITTDIEMDFRMLLPSSTMVENQLEDNMLPGTPIKRARLSKLSEAKESEAGTMQTNTTGDKTKQSNKSVSSKNKSKTSTDRDKSLNSSRTTRSMLKNASKRDEDVNTSVKPDTKSNKSLGKSSPKGNEVNVSPSKSDTDTQNKSQKQNRSRARNSPKAAENEIESEENVVIAINNVTRVINKSTNKSLPNTTNKSVNEKERTITIKVHKTGPSDEEQNEQEEDENNFSLHYENDNENIEEPNLHNDLNDKKDNNKTHNTVVLETETQETEINKSKSNKSSLTNKSMQKQKPAKTVEESVDSQTEQYSAEDNIDGNANKKKKMINQEIGEDINSREVSNEQMEQENENEVHISQEIEDDHNESQKEASNESREIENEQEESEADGHQSKKMDDDLQMDSVDAKAIENDEEEREADVTQNEKMDDDLDRGSAEANYGESDGEQSKDDVTEIDSARTEDSENEDENEADVTKSDEMNENLEMDSAKVEDNKNEESEDDVNQSDKMDDDLEMESAEANDNETDGKESEADVTQSDKEEEDLEKDSAEVEDNENEEESEDDVNQTDRMDDDLEMDSAKVEDNESGEEENEADVTQSDKEEDDLEMDSANAEDIDSNGEESEADVTQSDKDEDDVQMDSAEDDKAIASDPEISDNEDYQADEIEVDDVQEQSEHADEIDQHESQELNEIQPSSEEIDQSPDITHDTTGRFRKKDFNKSPEVILHDKTDQMDSFTVGTGRNTSVRKTKSMIKDLNIKPSLAPVRHSIGSNCTTNSSAEGSGWDSHRTTRKTLRQTFGKDFTPRKSLRALVMEKSAKRQTEQMAMHSETAKFPLANSTEMPEDSNHYVEDIVESDHEVSRRTRQTTLETYLAKIKEQNIEKKLKMEQAVRNSLKVPIRDSLSLFKVPNKPAPRRPKTAQIKPKKQIKSIIPFDELPSEVIEDMKYKPPKRFQPTNASWITKRLYKYLENKLEPKYDYKARVRAEKLVETLYHFTKDLRRHDTAPADAVEVLKHELARLDVVRTHFEFYELFHEFMPREIRVKVVPDIVNKIPLPRHGVFSDILRGNTVQG